MLTKLFPGLLWLKDYHQSTFRSDLLSGLVIAFMLIPQGMGYALVAGLPPEYGLYACIFPPIVYALLGTSNKISMGPVALDSILIITGLSVLAEPGSERYLELAVLLTLMVAVLQLGLGLAKFGFIANFLSYPVIVGYTSAAALIIMGSQFETMLGVDVAGGNIFVLLYQLFLQVPNWSWITLSIGILGMLIMTVPKKRFPVMPFPLFLLVFGMLASGIWELQAMGVDVVSSIPQGLPSFNLPNVSLSDLEALVPVAITVALMGYVGTMSICKSLENPTDKITTQPNLELIAVGAANLVGSLCRAFPVSASFSRSAAFREAGAKTQVSALFSSLFIGAAMLVVAPLFVSYPLPKVLLSAIIIVSVSGLFKYAEMKVLYAHNRREFYILLTTFLATLILGVQEGLLLGVSLSIMMMIYNTTSPHMTELGSIQNGKLYRNITRFTQAHIRDDVLIFRFDAPIYFANKDYFVSVLYRWIKQRDMQALQFVVLDAESINSLDSTGVIMLQQVIENLQKQGIQFYITNAIGPVRDTIKTSILSDYMTEKTMFSTINDAMVFIDRGINLHASQALQTNPTAADSTPV
ncbi:sulfate permease [Porticoccaceae bacterium]|jgi:SulP family sulfate permease|nr:sulfate permease [Porticoccaceae bacterium]MDB2319292.1 sulfate permease [Porticoccaceae bacterium]MDB2549581.1 sulfate permease [Porticoccaceae bacterium]